MCAVSSRGAVGSASLKKCGGRQLSARSSASCGGSDSKSGEADSDAPEKSSSGVVGARAPGFSLPPRPVVEERWNSSMVAPESGSVREVNELERDSAARRRAASLMPGTVPERAAASAPPRTLARNSGVRSTRSDSVASSWRRSGPPVAPRAEPSAPAPAPAPVTRFSTPSGRPASATSSARRSSDSEAISEGFTTTHLPAASAGAIFQAPIISGKFQGTMIPITPSGSRWISASVSGPVGAISP